MKGIASSIHLEISAFYIIVLEYFLTRSKLNYHYYYNHHHREGGEEEKGYLKKYWQSLTYISTKNSGSKGGFFSLDTVITLYPILF